MNTVQAARRKLLDFTASPDGRVPVPVANENLPGLGPDDDRHPGLSLRVPRYRRQASSDLRGQLALAWAEEQAHGRLMLFSPVLLGTGAGLWFRAHTEPPMAALGLALVLCTLTAVLNRYRRPAVALVGIMLALMACGAMLAALETWRAGTIVLDKPVTTTVRAIVESREASGEGRWRYGLRLLGTEDPKLKRHPETLTAVVRMQEQPFEPGDLIEGRARLTPPSGPALPGLSDLSFGSYFAGNGATGYFYGAPVFQSKEDGSGASLWTGAQSWLLRLRAGIGERIRSVVPGDAGAFAAAIVTNEQRALSAETIEALRLSGLAHIIAISGMNMVLAAGIFFVGLRMALSLATGFSQAYPVKKLAAAGSLLAVTAYYGISGFALSAERAYLMMAIMLIAVFFDRPAFSLRNIALSALAILVVTPSAGLSASFQMSYAGTMGLIAVYEYGLGRGAGRGRLQAFPLPGWISWLLKMLAGIVLTSLVGGTATALYSAAHFQRLAAYGLAANLLATPFISLVVMPFALLAMLLMPFGLDALPLQIAGWGLEWVIRIGKYVAGWGGEWLTGPVPVWLLACCSLGMVLMVIFRTRLRLVGLALVVSGAVVAWALPAPPAPDLLISEDGMLAALVTNGKLSPNRAKPSLFIFDQWQRATRIRDMEPPVIVEPPPDVRLDAKADRYRPLTDEEEIAERLLMVETAERATAGHFVCKKSAWCLASLRRGTRVMLVENSIYAGLGCEMADIIIANTGPRFTACRTGALLISREALRRTGALTLRETDNPRKPDISAALYGNTRPWTESRRYDWRTDSFTDSIPPHLRALLK